MAILRGAALRRRRLKGSTAGSGTTHIGSVSATIDTSVTGTSSLLLEASLSSSMETTVTTLSTVTRGGSVSALVETSTILAETLSLGAICSTSADTSTTLVVSNLYNVSSNVAISTVVAPGAGLIKSTTVNNIINTSVNLAHHLTKGAKCVIIGEVNVVIDSHNYKYVNISSEIDTSTLLSSTRVRNARAELTATCSTSLSSQLTYVIRTSVSIKTYSIVTGSLVYSCILNRTRVEEAYNNTKVTNLTNHTNTVCGAS